MLNDLLVKCLPKDAALTAVFDSCHSGTLLGDVPPIGISSLLSLIPRQTLYITSATVCITRRSPPTHSYVQQGGTRRWPVLRPRANPALGWEAAKVISHLPDFPPTHTFEAFTISSTTVLNGFHPRAPALVSTQFPNPSYPSQATVITRMWCHSGYVQRL